MLGLLVQRMLVALRAELLVRELFLKLFILVGRVILIFADLAPERNNDPGFFLRHNRRIVRLAFQSRSGELYAV